MWSWAWAWVVMGWDKLIIDVRYMGGFGFWFCRLHIWLFVGSEFNLCKELDRWVAGNGEGI